MKSFFIIFFTLSVNLVFAQKTYYGYQPRDNQKESSQLSDISLNLTVEGRTFGITLDGKLSSYSALMGDEINKDYSGKIDKVGNVEIKYDYSKRVESIGDNKIKYSSGKMESIGEYEVLYDYNGQYKGTRKKTNYRVWR